MVDQNLLLDGKCLRKISVICFAYKFRKDKSSLTVQIPTKE